jgi:hypothetical protein
MAAVMAITVAASSCGSAECEQILVRWREEWDTVKERVKSPQALLSISTIYKLKLLLAPLRPILLLATDNVDSQRRSDAGSVGRLERARWHRQATSR